MTDKLEKQRLRLSEYLILSEKNQNAESGSESIPATLCSATTDEAFFNSDSTSDKTENRRSIRIKVAGELQKIRTSRPTLKCLLRDYSRVGLGFSSNKEFYQGNPLIVSLRDPLEEAPFYLDFDFLVVRVVKTADGYVVGCTPENDVDQELWELLV